MKTQFKGRRQPETLITERNLHSGGNLQKDIAI